MDDSAEIIEKEFRSAPSYFTLGAAISVALIGLIDSAYLTAKHFTGNNVPCNIISGCEQVLNSQYSEIFGIPTAAFGAISYFTAFSLVVLAFYGNTKMWNLFGGLVSIMAIFTIWLVYLQAFVIGAFCQFCLISAGTSITLFLIFLLSKTLFKK